MKSLSLAALVAQMVWAVWLGIPASVLAGEIEVAGTDGGSVSAHERGLPFMHQFGAREYGAHAQNWDIVQHGNGLIYVANNNGVLEFDGARWQLISVANDAPVRSLALGPDGRIHVGAQGEIGYLEAGRAGAMRYHSLIDRLPEAWRDFSHVWRTFTTDEGVYFSTVSRLLRWDGDKFQSWEPETRFHFSFLVNGRLYILERERGLLVMEGDRLKPAPGGDRFADDLIYAILPWDGGERMLILARQQGFLLFDEGAYRPWPTEADAALENDLVYHAVRTPDDGIAIGTLQGGLYLLDAEGRWVGHLNRDTGLGDNSILYLHTDRENGLWLGLSRGIVRIETGNGLSHYGEDQGLSGSIYAIHRHRGRLYAATSQGLFRLESGPNTSWRAVEGVQSQTWDLLSFEDVLLAANNRGVYEIRGLEARLVRASDTTSYSLRKSTHKAGRVYVGLGDGLTAITRVNGAWRDEGQLADVSEDIRTIHESDDVHLWLGTRASGVLRVRLPDNGSLGPVNVDRFDTDDGLPDLLLNYGYELEGKTGFATREGLYRFDEQKERFVEAPGLVSGIDPRPTRLWPLVRGLDGRIWTQAVFDDAEPAAGAIVPTDDGNYIWQSDMLGALEGLTNYAIHVDDDGVVWLGGPEGLFRYDPSLAGGQKRSFQVLIRDVRDRSGESLLTGRNGSDRLEVDYERNRLRFEYAAPSFDGMDANRYQVKLEGQDREWSSWSSEAFVDYVNLWEGNYRFRVRAKNIYDVTSEEAVLDFRVLPPWYRTPWAYLAYVLLFVSAAWGILQWRLRRMEAQKRALRALVRERTRELEEATVTDQLTGLRNRRHLENHLDIDINKTLRDYADWRSGKSASQPAESDLLFFMIDIDHFKKVNDDHGHLAGDRVLQQLSGILRKAFRDSDLLVRMGGEEFLAIARFTRRDAAPGLAQRILQMVRAHEFDIDESQPLRLSCSVGFACLPFVPARPELLAWHEVVDIADHCLYAAKHAGRDAWVGVFAIGDDLDKDLLNRLHNEPGIMAADGRFQVMNSLPEECELVWQSNR